jgi:outer membrane receptor protein involved in Fe transport
MLYARFASGYRPGGTNLGAPGAPPTYAPDKTQNYEVGVKGDFLDHRLSVDASLYYISWKDLQMQLFLPNSLTYEANGSGAKSEGLEISLQSRPLSGLTLSGWFAYDNAVLTQAFPANGPAYGVPGTRLPNSSRFSGNLSVEQVFPLGTSATGFVGAMASYMGDREGLFTGSPGVPAPRQLYPAYTKTDVRAGVKYDAWTVNLYATNVFDKRGLIAGGLGYFLPTAFTTIPPRTVGVSVSKVF